MQEPNPTPSEQWSRWDTDPELPTYWPGLGAEHKNGFEIDHRGVRAVSSRMVPIARAIGSRDLNDVHGFYLQNSFWNLPAQISELLHTAVEAVGHFWDDLHGEIGMAGLLVERASARYDLAEKPLLGDIPLKQLIGRVDGASLERPFESFAPSLLYPNGVVSLELPKSVDYGVGDIGVMTAKDEIFHSFANFHSKPELLDDMADALVELAHKVRGHAQDLRDAPWYGEAADKVQGALRKVYGSTTALAATSAHVGTAVRNFQTVARWCQANYERIADPDRGGWSEFWDLGGTPESRTHDFLRRANEEFMKVYEAMPKRIAEDLPGLMVDDRGLASARRSVDWGESQLAKADSEYEKKEDREFLDQARRRYQGYEAAEQTYG